MDEKYEANLKKNIYSNFTFVTVDKCNHGTFDNPTFDEKLRELVEIELNFRLLFETLRNKLLRATWFRQLVPQFMRPFIPQAVVA